MVRSVPETEWDPEQVAWMRALEMYEADLCGGCGGIRTETTDPKYDFYNPESKLIFDAAPDSPMQCHRCAAIDRAQRETEASHPKHPAAMLHSIQLRPRQAQTTPTMG